MWVSFTVVPFRFQHQRREKIRIPFPTHFILPPFYLPVCKKHDKVPVFQTQKDCFLWLFLCPLILLAFQYFLCIMLLTAIAELDSKTELICQNFCFARLISNLRSVMLSAYVMCPVPVQLQCRAGIQCFRNCFVSQNISWSLMLKTLASVTKMIIVILLFIISVLQTAKWSITDAAQENKIINVTK